MWVILDKKWHDFVHFWTKKQSNLSMAKGHKLHLQLYEPYFNKNKNKIKNFKFFIEKNAKNSVLSISKVGEREVIRWVGRVKGGFFPSIFFPIFQKKNQNFCWNFFFSLPKWPNLGQIWVNFGQKGPFFKFPQKTKAVIFFGLPEVKGLRG